MITSRQNGFTLIEILIAIFILAIVLSTVYASYTGTFRIVKDTEYGDDIYSMARSTMERMITDLESVCKYRDSFRFISKRNESFQREFMNLSFLSSAHLTKQSRCSVDTCDPDDQYYHCGYTSAKYFFKV